MYTDQYAGESGEKIEARLFLYKHAAAGTRAGHAITLAGTEPKAEIELMRDYLRWPANRVWFIDSAKKRDDRERVLDALEEIRHEWPQANVVEADINRVIANIHSIGFANLDFTGLMNRKFIQPCVRSTIGKLLPGGTLGLTWYRGRETDSPHHSGFDVHEAARDIEDMGDRRWVGVMRMVEGWASEQGVRLSVVAGIEYQHRCSPMSITIWRRV